LRDFPLDLRAQLFDLSKNARHRFPRVRAHVRARFTRDGYARREFFV
jgi:hypothetical protein